LVKAFDNFKNFILKSDQAALNEDIKYYEPFIFDNDSQNQPCEYEVDFLIDGIRYTYFLSFNQKQILKESLHFYPKGRKSKLFERINNKYSYGEYFSGSKKLVENATQNNQLFLTKGAKNNMEVLNKFYSFIKNKIVVFNPFADKVNKGLKKTLGKIFLGDTFLDKKFTKLIQNLFSTVDSNIKGLRVKKNIDNEFDIFVLRKINNNGNGMHTPININEESDGIKKFLILSAMIIFHLEQKSTFIYDELERSFHTYLSQYIIKLYQNGNINSQNAQLLVTTHDTNLISEKTSLRRDQINIAEKDNEGQTELYSLSDFGGIKKDAPFDKWYLSGVLGGTPTFQNLEFEQFYIDEQKKANQENKEEKSALADTL
jgi:hypothetical protein